MPLLTGAREARLSLIARTGQNLSITDLAERLGRNASGDLNWSRSHLTSVENGNRPASEELISLLAFHLEVTRSQLISGTIPDRPPPQPGREKSKPSPPKKSPPPGRGPARVGEAA